MGMKDMFEELIEEGKSTKATLLDMLEEIRKRNGVITIITDDEYNTIKTRILAMPD